MRRVDLPATGGDPVSWDQRAAAVLRRGDLVAIGTGVYQVRETEATHPASVRLTFCSGERITVRRATRLDVLGNLPLTAPHRRRGARTQARPPDRSTSTTLAKLSEP
jgi:hypothetical protein